MSRVLRQRAEQACQTAGEIQRGAARGAIHPTDAITRLALVVEGLADTVAALSVESDQRAGMAVEVEMGQQS